MTAFQLLVHKPLTEWSRHTAIVNSQPLLDDIERFKSNTGNYPLTLNAVSKDYKTGIAGIEKYHYTYDGSTYNLYFKQPRFLLDRPGTWEYVVYNPSETHLMISHASWHLLWEQHQIRATQGWYKSNNSSVPHWTYFWFD